MASSVKVIDLYRGEPLAKDRAKDYSDWRDEEHSLQELHTIAEAAPELATGQASSSGSPWAKAMSAPDFVQASETEAAWLDRPLLARGSITEIFSPRGIGKTHVALAKVVEQARRGRRVLYIDRDNSKREVRRRLRLWGGADVPNLKILTRDDAPPLTDSAEWAAFPFAEYDLVVIDSLDASTEGVGEQDSARPSRARATPGHRAWGNRSGDPGTWQHHEGRQARPWFRCDRGPCGHCVRG